MELSPLGPTVCSMQANSGKIRVHQQPQCPNPGLNPNSDLYSSLSPGKPTSQEWLTNPTFWVQFMCWGSSVAPQGQGCRVQNQILNQSAKPEPGSGLESVCGNTTCRRAECRPGGLHDSFLSLPSPATYNPSASSAGPASKTYPKPNLSRRSTATLTA